MNSILSTVLSFLRRAHFLHGFLGGFILFNAVSVLVLWFAAPPSDERYMIGLLMLLVSLLLSLVAGFTWDDAEQKLARWRAAQERENEHRAFMLEKARQISAFYKGNPDFLGVGAQSSSFLTLYVKAAPHGHAWPHKWDGVPVMIVVKSPESWASFNTAGLRAR